MSIAITEPSFWILSALAGGRRHGYRIMREVSELSRGRTMHGFALNCDNSLAGFRGIIPCGITDAGVTTLSEVVGSDISPGDVLDTVSRAFEAEYAGVSA